MNISQLVVALLIHRTSAHLQHLLAKSWASHVALQSLYEALEKSADAIAESYMGLVNERLNITSNRTSIIADSESLLNHIESDIAAARSFIGEAHEKVRLPISNLLDELAADVGSVRYKLKFLP